mmetsp:Transcript_22004/g.38731  ORF Transcript_22004/g.38731 Transcript_22004/m.38731 type:complete len:156 (+) Transcript_22004:80-547(+)
MWFCAALFWICFAVAYALSESRILDRLRTHTTNGDDEIVIGLEFPDNNSNVTDLIGSNGTNGTNGNNTNGIIDLNESHPIFGPMPHRLPFPFPYDNSYGHDHDNSYNGKIVTHHGITRINMTNHSSVKGHSKTVHTDKTQDTSSHTTHHRVIAER